MPNAKLHSSSWIARAWSSAIFAAAVLLFPACRPPAPVAALPPPEANGYRQTVIGQTVIAEAIRRANLLMQNQVRIRLQPGWLPDQYPTRTPEVEPISLVPVYLIFPDGLAASAVAFVPKDKSCVFVNSARVRDLAPAFGFQPEELFGGDMDLHSIWTVILMHEAGHIFYSDQDRREQSMIGDAESLNVAKEMAKIVEFRADHFAAVQIKITESPGFRGDWMAGLAPAIEHAAAARYLGNPVEDPPLIKTRIIGSEVQMMINTIGLQVWSNLADRRENLSEGELKTLAWDQGFSHPNLALRFLYMASVLDRGNWATQKQLDDFLQVRNQKAHEALYRSEYTGLQDGVEPRPPKAP